MAIKSPRTVSVADALTSVACEIRGYQSTTTDTSNKLKCIFYKRLYRVPVSRHQHNPNCLSTWAMVGAERIHKCSQSILSPLIRTTLLTASWQWQQCPCQHQPPAGGWVPARGVHLPEPRWGGGLCTVAFLDRKGACISPHPAWGRPFVWPS